LTARDDKVDGLAADPNDPIFPLQWHHAVLGTTAAWEIADGRGVIVGVVDSGVRCDHRDLAGQCVPGWDFVEGDDDPGDAHGSGTFMAGIVAAVADNGVGVAGMAPGARIMPLRVLDGAGAGDLDRLAEAIRWGADHGAQVLVVGLASRFETDGLRAAVADAVARGVVVVASVGIADTDDRLFPAVYPGVLGVAVTDKADARAPICGFGDTVDVAAPGIDILSTTYEGRYYGEDGSRYAAAVAAGAAALLKSQKPDRSPDLVAEILRVTATDLGDRGWDPYFGAGRIHAGRALALDPAGTPPVPTTGPSPSDQPPDPTPSSTAPPAPGPTRTPAPPIPTVPPGPTSPLGPTAPPANPTPVVGYPTSTPGTPPCRRPWQITLLGLPDLSGAGGYICPGCDGILSSGDRWLATLCPLEPLEVVITDAKVGVGAARVLWHGFIRRTTNQVQEIRFNVYLCDPPPYHAILLSTRPMHYSLCPNSPQVQTLEQKDFDRISGMRGGEGRRGQVGWSFWSCAAWRP